MTKQQPELPIAQLQSLDIVAEQLSNLDAQHPVHPVTVTVGHFSTDPTETTKPEIRPAPAPILQHGQSLSDLSQSDALSETETAQEEQPAMATIQEPLVSQSEFPTDPGLHAITALAPG